MSSTAVQTSRAARPLTSPPTQPRFPPTFSNTPPPSPTAPAHTPPKPHPESPAHFSSHPQNSKLRTRTLPRHPTVPYNQTISASPLPPLSHDPQNSHTQTPPAALLASSYAEPPASPAQQPSQPVATLLPHSTR